MRWMEPVVDPHENATCVRGGFCGAIMSKAHEAGLVTGGNWCEGIAGGYYLLMWDYGNAFPPLFPTFSFLSSALFLFFPRFDGFRRLWLVYILHTPSIATAPAQKSW